MDTRTHTRHLIPPMLKTTSPEREKRDNNTIIHRHAKKHSS
jgi:hypothetical protein